jgi:acetyl esterase/lipase
LKDPTMNFQNLSRFARPMRPARCSRTRFAGPKAWAALIVLGCVGLVAMAQTAAPTSGGTADRTADSAAIRATPARPAVQGAAQGAASSPAQLIYQTESGLAYRPDSEPDVYARERCKLDVYHPVGASAAPTVVWFHGGGLTGGNRSIPSALKGQGIIVVAVDYRLSPKAKAPAYIEDAAAAVAWTFKNIARYGGDTNRIFLSGHSAGGYLASLVTLDRRWLAVHGVDPDRLAGLVPFSGQSITHFAIREERGLGLTRPLIDDLAPVYHVRKDAPPILLISGDRNHELLGRYEESAYFWRMLKEVGHPSVELLELQGYDHGQMAEPAFPLLLRFLRQHGQ